MGYVKDEIIEEWNFTTLSTGNSQLYAITKHVANAGTNGATLLNPSQGDYTHV
jgi:hypothetical protein